MLWIRVTATAPHPVPPVGGGCACACHGASWAAGHPPPWCRFTEVQHMLDAGSRVLVQSRLPGPEKATRTTGLGVAHFHAEPSPCPSQGPLRELTFGCFLHSPAMLSFPLLWRNIWPAWHLHSVKIAMPSCEWAQHHCGRQRPTPAAKRRPSSVQPICKGPIHSWGRGGSQA